MLYIRNMPEPEANSYTSPVERHALQAEIRHEIGLYYRGLQMKANPLEERHPMKSRNRSRGARVTWEEVAGWHDNQDSDK